MPRRKQAKQTTVKDLRSILRLTHEHGLSVRAISERLQVSKTSVATYLLRAREAGLSWPLPPTYDSAAALERLCSAALGARRRTSPINPIRDRSPVALRRCNLGREQQELQALIVHPLGQRPGQSAAIRKAVCDILEGGEVAFRERARRLRVHLDR